MSQQELADAVGAHWITISKLERGKIKLTTSWLEKLADPLGVTPADLLPSTKIIAKPVFAGSVAADGTVTILPKSKQLRGNLKSTILEVKGSFWIEIDGPAYEPTLHFRDEVQILPLSEWDGREEGRLCLFEFKKRVGRFGFPYRASKPEVYDLFWLGRRILKGVKPFRIWLVGAVIFYFAEKP